MQIPDNVKSTLSCEEINKPLKIRIDEEQNNEIFQNIISKNPM